MSDFVMTIDSDAEDVPISSTSKAPKAPKKSEPVDDAKLDPDFVFDIAGDPYIDLTNKATGLGDLVKTGSKPVCTNAHTNDLSCYADGSSQGTYIC